MRLSISSSRVVWAAASKAAFDLGLVAECPVEGEIVGRFGMDRLAADGCVDMGGKVVVIELDQVERVERLGLGLRHDRRETVAGETDLAGCEDRPDGGRAFAAVAVVDDVEIHRVLHLAVEIGGGEDAEHARRGARGAHVEARDGGVRDGASEDHEAGDAVWRDVVEIAAVSGEKAHVLLAADGLAGSEFRGRVHGRAPGCRLRERE